MKIPYHMKYPFVIKPHKRKIMIFNLNKDLILKKEIIKLIINHHLQLSKIIIIFIDKIILMSRINLFKTLIEDKLKIL
jgi:hypothetical protein